MRAALLILIVPLLAPSALGDGSGPEAGVSSGPRLLGASPAGNDADPCEPQHWAIGGEIVPMVHAGIETEERECGDFYSYQISIIDPDGRTDVIWYDDERGVGVEIVRSPRFILWLDDERGCIMVVYLFGAIEQGCPLGPPPPPPHVPL
ncbi:MAG: hypothetical protein ABIO65_09590 [Nitrospiria bacterium]